jgi:hypothetical protein
MRQNTTFPNVIYSTNSVTYRPKHAVITSSKRDKMAYRAKTRIGILNNSLVVLAHPLGRLGSAPQSKTAGQLSAATNNMTSKMGS